uniref:phosphoglycolate phosphatase n=1 Tax=Rhizophora mucronata TaxID=61149 RepID=A0A2P2K8A2_RHIMU
MLSGTGACCSSAFTSSSSSVAVTASVSVLSSKLSICPKLLGLKTLSCNYHSQKSTKPPAAAAAAAAAAASTRWNYCFHTTNNFFTLGINTTYSITPVHGPSSTSRRRGMENMSVRASAAQPLKNADQLINSVETFIFDCDGVIWKGDKLIDGVPQTLDMLRSKGKRLVFVTNNSTKSRKQYGKKFETLGLNVIEEEIFASSFAAAAYLQSINFPKDKKVYVIGEDGILKELELAGFQFLGGPEDGGKMIELKPGFLMDHDPDVGVVVVGFDRYCNYYKIQYATLCIRENPGCLFIATNRDAVTHLTDAQEWAGGGSMVGAIAGSTQREPLVVGKPSTFMMDYLANKFGILKSQICMVGDRLDTDILFGQNGGCKTLLVLSGVTSLSMLQSPSNPIQPDFYTNKISDFLSLKAAAV